MLFIAAALFPALSAYLYFAEIPFFKQAFFRSELCPNPGMTDAGNTPFSLTEHPFAIIIVGML